MTAAAPGPWKARPSSAARTPSFGGPGQWRLGALLLLAPLGLAAPAAAQVAVSATLDTNYLYRGVSLSDGRPTLDLDLAYDGPGGIYGGVSAIGEAARAGPRGLGDQAFLGYAIRAPGGPTLDLGVDNLGYRTEGPRPGYVQSTEVYAGWVTSRLNAYVHYSPDAFVPGVRTLYGEVNGSLRLQPRWRLFGHAGALSPLGAAGDQKARFDFRAGVAAAFKGGEVRLAWTTARPNLDYGSDAGRGRDVVALGLTVFF